MPLWKAGMRRPVGELNPDASQWGSDNESFPKIFLKKGLTIRPGCDIIKSEKTKEEPKMTDLGFEWDITAEEVYGAMAGEEEGEEF